MTLNEAADEILKVFGYGREPDISVPTEVVVKIGMRERILPFLRQLAQSEYQRGYFEGMIDEKEKERRRRKKGY